LLASSCAGSAQALQTGLKLASAVQFVHKSGQRGQNVLFTKKFPG
jgi:hypothetical protein